MVSLLSLSYTDQWTVGLTAALIIGAIVYVGIKLKKYLVKQKLRQGMKNLAEIKGKTIKDLTQKLDVTPDNKADNVILGLSLKELIQKLQSKDLKASEVLEVYQRKALEAHGKTNCLTGVIVEADETALWLDGLEKVAGPLHGVPVSLKDNLPLQGYISSMGLGKMCHMKALEDCSLVKVLKAQGAIPFAQTGVPQILMSYETSNPIYGRVSNPVDPSRGPGGSTGGEGALIKLGGSILGFGTDIGGSIRAPCAFCGICGLKPTSNRISFPSLMRGQTIVQSSVGPLAQDVEGLAIAMKAVLVPYMFKLDPKCPPIPFRTDIYEGKQQLTIGYYTDDGVCPACPAAARAVMMAKDIMQKAGHKMVPWTPPDASYGVSAVAKSFCGDGGKSIAQLLKDEDVDPCIVPYQQLSTTPKPQRFFWSLYNKYIKNRSRFAKLISDFCGLDSVYEWWRLTTEVQNYREIFNKNWNANKLNAVLAPAFTFPALKHSSSWQYMRSGNYLMLYNLLDLPAGIMPVTQVTTQDIAALDGWSTGDDIGEYVRQDQQNAEGLPVAVQVVSSRWQEEMCLRVMRQIEQGVMAK